MRSMEPKAVLYDGVNLNVEAVSPCEHAILLVITEDDGILYLQDKISNLTIKALHP